MLTAFLYTLRALKVPVGTQEWLTLMEALSEDLAESSLDRFYYLARSILVKSEAAFDTFDQAFLMCFSATPPGFDLGGEIWQWLEGQVKKRPEMPLDAERLDLEELRRRFLERLREQLEEHHGGNRWIGTGGTSPFGHSGAHPSGIRVGGTSGGRSAMQVAAERRFANYRQDRVLDTRQFKVALKRLRQLERVGLAEELQIDATIAQTSRNAGEIELVFAPPHKNQVELLLIMDVGGTMDPHAHLVEALFSAAHSVSHFKSFQHFFFHNCIYSKLFTDMARNESIPTAELSKKYHKNFRVIIVGDACMNPYELLAAGGAIDYWEMNPTSGMEWLRLLKQHFPLSVWLNPEPVTFWSHPTIDAIAHLIKMYPMTLAGLTEAINDLRAEDVHIRI